MSSVRFLFSDVEVERNSSIYLLSLWDFRDGGLCFLEGFRAKTPLARIEGVPGILHRFRGSRDASARATGIALSDTGNPRSSPPGRKEATGPSRCDSRKGHRPVTGLPQSSTLPGRPAIGWPPASQQHHSGKKGILPHNSHLWPIRSLQAKLAR